MINTVVLHFGYVESTKLAALVCTNQYKTFASEAEAIVDLAQDLLAHYKERFAPTIKLRKCCEKFKKDESNEFCGKCGGSLKNDFDPRLFKEWLLEMQSYDLDSFGYDEYPDDREVTWEIGGSPMVLCGLSDDDVAVVKEKAESYLVECLGLELFD